MKTLQQIKDEVAKENGFDEWIDLYDYELSKIDLLITQVAKRYAEEALMEAADKAKVIKTGNSGSYYDASVDKQSILSLIKELQ